MAIALEVHSPGVKNVHDQAAAKTELMLVCSGVALNNARVLLLNDVDEKRCVIALIHHAGLHRPAGCRAVRGC